jgi:putative intracellular protease/amidase
VVLADRINSAMAKKILVVVTGVEKYPDLNRATGIWLGEVVHFVKVVESAGMQVDYASPEGGYTPIDPKSLEGDNPSEWEWYHNKTFMNRLGSTLRADTINSDDYSAIYFVGGHGVLWDFPDNKRLQDISKQIYESGGVVSGVCHGVVGLLNIKLSDGSLLVAGKRVTGFSNDEEEVIGMVKHVPFLPENELVARGAKYEKGSSWESNAVADARVVTGQNPASGEAVAKLVLEALKQ